MANSWKCHLFIASSVWYYVTKKIYLAIKSFFRPLLYIRFKYEFVVSLCEMWSLNYASWTNSFNTCVKELFVTVKIKVLNK